MLIVAAYFLWIIIHHTVFLVGYDSYFLYIIHNVQKKGEMQQWSVFHGSTITER